MAAGVNCMTKNGYQTLLPKLPSLHQWKLFWVFLNYTHISRLNVCINPKYIYYWNWNWNSTLKTFCLLTPPSKVANIYTYLITCESSEALQIRLFSPVCALFSLFSPFWWEKTKEMINGHNVDLDQRSFAGWNTQQRSFPRNPTL